MNNKDITIENFPIFEQRSKLEQEVKKAQELYDSLAHTSTSNECQKAYKKLVSKQEELKKFELDHHELLSANPIRP